MLGAAGAEVWYAANFKSMAKSQVFAALFTSIPVDQRSFKLLRPLIVFNVTPEAPATVTFPVFMFVK
jgi:hypothetical protein